MKITWRLIGLLVVAAFPVLPDFVDASISGDVGSFFDVMVRCDSCAGGFGVDGGGPGGTFTSFGTLSRSGGISFTDPGSGRFAAVSGTVDETSEATSNSFSIDVLHTTTVTGLGAQWGGSGSSADRFTLVFTLTQESVMNLTDSGWDPISLMDSAGTLTLLPFFGGDFTLAPDTYQLMGVSNLPLAIVPQPNSQFGTNYTLSDEFSLTATFTPIPEPAGAYIVPLLLIVATAFFSHRRQRI